tara:strand:- start:248 stop:748 length:501 start_codon:yes stop_codon:yes gene_type:complete
MKKLLSSLFIVAFGCYSLSAQEAVRSTISASGSSSSIRVNDRDYVIQQSVGQQSIIGTSQSSVAIMRQGFIQPPIEVFALSETDNSLDAVVYPNPFQNIVHVRFNETLKKPVNIVLYDVLGRIVRTESKVVTTSETSIHLDGLSSAQYILTITSENKEFKTSLLKK